MHSEAVCSQIMIILHCSICTGKLHTSQAALEKVISGSCGSLTPFYFNLSALNDAESLKVAKWILKML
jgi:hypothetical protein